MSPRAEEYHARFTDLDRGRAQLVAVWRGESVAAVLARRFPGVPVIEYCSLFPSDWKDTSWFR